MNINNLQVQLQTAVENAATEASTDNTSATLYYLQLAKAIQALNMGQIRTIDQVSNLPSAAASEGWLYFVDNIERLYFSNGTVWADIAPATVYNNTAWMWSRNTWGNLGDNTTTSKSSPVSVVGGFTDWCQVSAGFTTSSGIRRNGTLWSWGLGQRLGDNSVVDKSSPVSVVGGFTDWCQVSAGFTASLAVRQNGTAWAWGDNNLGQLGDNTVTNRSSPVSVVGGFTDWCQVASSMANISGHGVRQNGTLWSWGYNATGKLGDNTITSRSSPVSVVGGFTDWCQVSSGYFTAAVRQNGTLWAWGSNTCGRLGNNSTTNRSSPVSVVGGFTDWCQISASTHGLGLRTNGSAWAWGCNNDGQLGDNTTVAKSSPVSVVGGFTNWCQVSAGYRFGTAIRTNGTIWAWGYGSYGRLGNNSTTNRSSPVLVVGGFTDWYRIGYPQVSETQIAIRSTL